VVAAVDSRRNSIRAPRYGNAECNGKHDCIAVWNNGGAHRLLGVMPVGNHQAVGQCRSSKQAADIGYIYDVMLDPEAHGAQACTCQLSAMALAVVERDEMVERALRSYFVGQDDGIESPGTDH
jgi:hypothetical protein